MCVCESSSLLLLLQLTSCQTSTPGGAEKNLGFQDGRVTQGPGSSPILGPHPAQPGTCARVGRMPVSLPVLLRHAAVPGTQRYHQHPATGTAGERECDRDVSTMLPLPCMRLRSVSGAHMRRCWWSAKLGFSGRSWLALKLVPALSSDLKESFV